MTNPFLGFFKTLYLFISQKVKFDKTKVNKVIKMPDGKEFTIFRKVDIKGKSEPEAFFIVRFKLNGMSIEKNIKFSRIPIMIFMGFTGFRSKYWAIDYKSGTFQGFYEWQTVKDAENYSKSIAMKFMTKRSIPESVEFKIIDKSKEQFDVIIN